MEIRSLKKKKKKKHDKERDKRQIARRILQGERHIGRRWEDKETGETIVASFRPALCSAGVSLVMVNGLSSWLGKQLYNDKC